MRIRTATRSAARLVALLALSSLASTAAQAEPDDDRVYVTPLISHITFDATDPWNSIDPTVLYGGRVGVKVTRWFGIDATVGYAFANGNFGIAPDGMGGFEETDSSGKDVDVLYFGLDGSFHPLQGRLDPYLSAGWAMMQYKYDFDSIGFKDWLGDNGADFDLGDLKTASGWELGLGVGYALRITDRSRWSVVAEVKDVVVRSTKLEILGPGGEEILEPEYGHNIVFNLGFEFAWGTDSDAVEEPVTPPAPEPTETPAETTGTGEGGR